MNNYWANRIERAQTALSNKSQKAIDKQLKKYYRRAAERVIENFKDTYNQILLQIESGKEPSPALLYKLDDYWKQQAAVRHELNKLGEKQIALMTKEFELHYFDIYYSFSMEGIEPFNTIDNAGVRQMIKSSWLSDGKTFSQRVWENTNRLIETLNDELINCIATGAKTTKLKQLLQERFNVSYRRANTLARTELAHIQTRAAEDRYKSYGIQFVEILVDVDSRTCEQCKELVGKKFPINNAPVLPLHPNERCCLVPVID